MREITDSEISDTTAKFLRYLYKIDSRMLIVDAIIITNIGLCYDKGHPCGIKELLADLHTLSPAANIKKSRVSKSIKRWLKHGFIVEDPKSDGDRRHRYYVPTQKMFDSRGVAFNDIRAMHERLRKLL